jgi:hypothetical protein
MPLNTSGQFDAKITGVDFRLENNNIIVTYSITDYLPNQVFTIHLKFIAGDNKTITATSVIGDVGPGIYGGKDKTIIWDVGRDLPYFNGILKAVVSVIIPPKTSNDFSKVFPTATKERGTGGPGYVGLSFLFPGTGGYFVEKNSSRAIGYNVLAAAVLTSIIVHNVKLSDLNKQYDAASSAQKPSIQSDIDKTEETLKTAYIAYAVIWGTDLLWVAFKGVKNQKEKALRNRGYSSNGIILGYSNNRLTAGYRFTF